METLVGVLIEAVKELKAELEQCKCVKSVSVIMALQTSGAISLNDIHVEVGGTSGTLCSLNDADFCVQINVGNNANQSLQLYYGKLMR